MRHVFSVQKEDVWLLHKRLCHMNFDNLVNIGKMKKVRGLAKLKNSENEMCKQCQLGKMTKSSCKRKTYTSSNIFELVHTNLCGTIDVQSYHGDKYFILFVDDHSRMMNMMFLKVKSNSFQLFKWYLAIVEKEIRKSMKCLRSDKGGEFISNKFNASCNEEELKGRCKHQGSLLRMK